MKISEARVAKVYIEELDKIDEVIDTLAYDGAKPIIIVSKWEPVSMYYKEVAKITNRVTHAVILKALRLHRKEIAERIRKITK